MHRWGSRYMLRGLLLVIALCRSAAVRPCERRLGSCRKDKQREFWRARHLQRFSELGGDRHDLRGPMRQRVVSDTMHHRLVRQAHASLEAPTDAITFGAANCSTQEACRERFRYPDHHAVECSNATRGFEYLVDLRCGHPCEKAFFHRIESCMQPMYALLRLATTRGASALVERSGWLSGGLEEVFWTELEPVSELLRYDDRSRGVTRWDGC